MNGDGGDIDDPVTGRIIACIIRVHRELGPGFLEGIYRRALSLEFRRRGVRFEAEREVVVHYDGEQVGCHRLDMLVEGRVVVELKTVEALNKAHYAQIRSYLKATGAPLGLLVNFSLERADFRRVTLP